MLYARFMSASAIALLLLSGAAEAGEKEELLKLRNTTENLIKQLVKQGVLTQEAAQSMIQQAEAEAQTQAGNAPNSTAETVPPDEVRVTYVPEFVKDEIREQVRSELRQDVTNDVVNAAKKEGWGTADALPEWVRKFKLSGDIRLRSENSFYADDNQANSIFNIQEINQRGGQTAAFPDAFLNTTTDNHRLRARVRLGVDADITKDIKAGIRLATGNFRDPVSTNQTLGQTGSQYNFNVDRAYLQYDLKDSTGFNLLTLTGGRMKNPWFVGGGEFTSGSELVWDTDLSFEGIAATGRYNLDPKGQKDLTRLVYATAGAFPLQEAPFSHNDKWLLGGQVGVDWGFKNRDKLKFAIGYFDYQNLVAKPNSTLVGTCDTNSRANTASMPEFVQGGNSLATICHEGNQLNPGNAPGMRGLASDFNIVNVNMRYDFALFDPIYLTFSADYAKNVGFDLHRARALQSVLGNASASEQTTAWQVRGDIGALKVDKFGKWNLFFAYKSVGSDAVLDAYSDSDFHLGGTNAKGWILGGNYGLFSNVWLTGRWLSTDSIVGPNYGVDLLQVDINTKF